MKTVTVRFESTQAASVRSTFIGLGLLFGVLFIAILLFERPDDLIWWFGDNPMVLVLPILAVAMPVMILGKGPMAAGAMTIEFDTGTNEVRTAHKPIARFEEIAALFVRTRGDRRYLHLYLPGRWHQSRATFVHEGRPEDLQLDALVSLLGVPVVPVRWFDVAATQLGIERRPLWYVVGFAAAITTVAVVTVLADVEQLRASFADQIQWGAAVEALMLPVPWSIGAIVAWIYAWHRISGGSAVFPDRNLSVAPDE